MAEMLFKTKGNASPSGKARVYFTCHPDDFNLYFDQVCEYIFKSHDCAIYYAEDMSSVMDETDLESCNLFVAPVTFKLLSTENRAMDDVRFALEKHIPVLPLMMESGLDAIYSRSDKFGELQYLSPLSTDTTEVSFEEKLKKYLESVLVSDEMAKRVRAAFDAYIFLSYRKKDRKYANQLMRIIHEKPECRDIAIWYDEFLTPGESFRENIDKILADSKLFTLLVTPNLLEDHNFVMDNEYPAAVKSGIGILPAEMEQTDKAVLAEKYENLPEIANPYDDEAFRNRLVDTLSNLAIKSNDSDPEHNFLIGLAYLDGIDVEVNRERGLELITKAADAELPEAMEKLYNMYFNGTGVKLNYNKATEWAEKLMDYHNNKSSPIHKSTLTWVNNLAHCYRLTGNYSESVELHELAYQIKCVIFGKEHPSTLLSLSNLGTAYHSLKNYKKAIEIGENAYQIKLKVFGENHPETLMTLNNLAVSLGSVGDYSRAIDITEKVYKARLELLGEVHKDTLTSASNLADYYKSTENYSKAGELIEKSYQISCKTLGDGHPDTIIYLNNMAEVYYSLNDFSKAAELLEKAYQLNIKTFGTNNPSSLLMMNNLALSYQSLGDFPKAIELYEKLYPLWSAVLGEKDPDILKLLNNLAVCHLVAKNHSKALEIGKKSYHLNNAVFGEYNPYTVLSLNCMATAYRLLGNRSKAIELYDKVYQLSIKIYGEISPEANSALSNLLTYSFNVELN